MFDAEPFGQRAVRLGLATSQQVRQALETQDMLKQKAGLLGEILVEEGWLDPQNYMETVQEIVAEAEQKGHSGADLQEVFAKRVVEKGHVSPGTVAKAMELQSEPARKFQLIGQIMVEMGFLNDQERNRIVATYLENGQSV